MNCGADAEPRRERVLDRGGFLAEALVDRIEALLGTPNTIAPRSSPIGCASWIVGPHRRLQRVERNRPRLDHVVESGTRGPARSRPAPRSAPRSRAPARARAPAVRRCSAPAAARRARREHRAAPASARAGRAPEPAHCARRPRAGAAHRRPTLLRAVRPDRAASPHACALRGARCARPRLRARAAGRRWPGRGCRRSPGPASRCRAPARRCPCRCASVGELRALPRPDRRTGPGPPRSPEERVAQRAQQVVGDAAGVVARATQHRALRRARPRRLRRPPRRAPRPAARTGPAERGLHLRRRRAGRRRRRAPGRAATARRAPNRRPGARSGRAPRRRSRRPPGRGCRRGGRRARRATAA